MGCLTQEMLEENLFDSAELMQVGASTVPPHGRLCLQNSGILLFQEVYSMAVFPFPQLAELREKYTYNITPFPTSVKSNGRFVHAEHFSRASPQFRSSWNCLIPPSLLVIFR